MFILIIRKLIIKEGKKHWLVKLLFSKFFFGLHEKSIEKLPRHFIFQSLQEEVSSSRKNQNIGPLNKFISTLGRKVGRKYQQTT